MELCLVNLIAPLIGTHSGLHFLSSESARQVLLKVSKEAEEELAKYLDDGLRQALNIIESSEKETMQEVSKIMKTRIRQAETSKRKVVGSSELESRNQTLQFIEKTVNSISSEALARIEDYHLKDNYRRSLEKSLAVAIEALGDQPVVVSCNKRDHSLVKAHVGKLSKEKKLSIKMDADQIETAGGLKVRNVDGTMIYDNTLEARLTRLKPVIRKRIAQLLLESA